MKATEEKQITERFSQAVGFLGKPELEVRLGRIYALERISRDSQKDYWQIIEILTAYVRTKAPLQNNSNRLNDEEVKEHDIPIDIQAVLTILKRRNSELVSADLQQAKLGCAQLQGANLKRANLRQAKLMVAQLQSIKLNGKKVRKTNLEDADLRESDFSGANLTNANLARANLVGAVFERADLSKVDFSGAILDNVNFSGAILIGANLSKVKLDKTIGLTRPQIQQAQQVDVTSLPDYLK
ncbi:hypothetical protein CEN39_03715 [Fischerella thermalis CCMEE 5201]|nr:hypothetical protein CEN39_03715 [Fischerella thermalis CCMEE 5201]